MLLSVSVMSILITLLALPFGLALECTSSNALQFPPPVTSGSGTGTGGSGHGDVCDRICNDELCYQLCRGNKLKARETLDCTTSETCYLNPDDQSLVCLNRATGYYHDDEGGNGNVLEGTYTAADEQATTQPAVETLSSAAVTATSSGLSIAVPTPSIFSTLSVPTIQASSPVDSASTPTAYVAPATTYSTSGVERLAGRNVACGLLGLVVGVLVA